MFFFFFSVFSNTYISAYHCVVSWKTVQKYLLFQKHGFIFTLIFVKLLFLFVNWFLFLSLMSFFALQGRFPVVRVASSGCGGGNVSKQLAQHGLWNFYGNHFAVAGLEAQLLLGDVDVMDGRNVDDVFPSEPLEAVRVVYGQKSQPLLDAWQSERNHELRSREVEHVGIVVVGHEVECLVEVNQVELFM